MSLILEALRKSEAERQRGQAPGLFTGDASALMPVRERTPRLAPLLALSSIAVLALAMAWWLAAGPVSPDMTKDPKAAAPASKSAAPEGQGDASARARSSPPMPAASPWTPSDPVPVAPEPTSSKPHTAVAALRPEAPPLAHPAPAPARPEAPARTTPAPEPPVEPTATEDPAPSLAALPQVRRQQLPPLKLSMHVYADDASRRFAIIDGQRVTEGSRLGDVVVEHVRRDGVLVVVDGDRYLLPRP